MDKQPNNTHSNKNVSTLRFIITYVVLMGVFLLLIGLEPIKQVLDINGLYTELIVNLSALILKPFGIVKQIKGSMIFLTQGPVLNVRFGCNGLEAFLIYSVAILAYPAPKTHKIAGIVIGFLVLQFFNIMRIAALALSAIYLKNYFEYIHIYAAQGIMIAIALILFLAWLHFTPAPSGAQDG